MTSLWFFVVTDTQVTVKPRVEVHYIYKRMYVVTVGVFFRSENTVHILFLVQVRIEIASSRAGLNGREYKQGTTNSSLW